MSLVEVSLGEELWELGMYLWKILRVCVVEDSGVF